MQDGELKGAAARCAEHIQPLGYECLLVEGGAISEAKRTMVSQRGVRLPTEVGYTADQELQTALGK